MGNKEKIERLTEERFQELFGVKKATFELMLEVLERKYAEEHRSGGRTGKLSVLDRLVIMLQYYRAYDTMDRIAFEYEVAKSTVSDTITWTERTLIRHGGLPMPKKRKLPPSEVEIAIDVTEMEIERPKKNKSPITQEKRSGTR